MKIDIQIQIGERMAEATLSERVELTTERCGMPAKLTFTALAEGLEDAQEGGCVLLTLDGTRMFQGYIFTISDSGDDRLKFTAYDQLRYLKNRDSYAFPDATAGQIVGMIGEDYGMRLGEISDTAHVISAHVEDNVGLLDMIQSAIDLTLGATRELYVLYDDGGRLTLKNVREMQWSTVIDADCCTAYSHLSSIDSLCYNRVKLVCEDAEDGRRLFISGDAENQDRWGTLQYFERIDEASVGQAQADALLALYNAKARSLRVNLAFADAGLRAGCLVPVQLKTGRGEICEQMLVEKCRQVFEKGGGSAELTLRGI